MDQIKFEYGFESVNGIVKKKYYLHEIPFIREKCDVWNVLPLVYVRRFTGWIDKNNKELLENDIVKTKYQDLAKIIWHNDFSCFCYETIDEIVKEEIQFWFKKEDLEYKGNIYETPELLCKND